MTYKPFGPVVTSTGSDKFTYAGEMLDSPTGLVYLFARYYDPELGRFYALDPELGEANSPQSLNRFLYCGNSPLIRTDPTGKFWNIIIGAAIGAVVGAAFSIATQYATGGWDSIDWGTVALEAGIGAATGALAGATMGASIFAGNMLARGALAATPRLAKGISVSINLFGAFSSGALSSATGDVLHGEKIDQNKAFWSGVYSAGTFGFNTYGVTPAFKQAPSLAKYTKSLASEKHSFPNAKWDGFLFDERPVNCLPKQTTPYPEGFHSNPTQLGIEFDTIKSIGSKILLNSATGSH